MIFAVTKTTRSMVHNARYRCLSVYRSQYSNQSKQMNHIFQLSDAAAAVAADRLPVLMMMMLVMKWLSEVMVPKPLPVLSWQVIENCSVFLVLFSGESQELST